MKVLIVGQGAREHALAWKLKSSSQVTELYAWPGNSMIHTLAKSINVDESANHQTLIQNIKPLGLDYVVVGPEVPLSEGLADELGEAGIKCFGPIKKAAMLESSKEFSKKIMNQAGVPTADFKIATDKSNCEKLALDQLNKNGGVVLKASGLAGGKGVFVCMDKLQVENALRMLYSKMEAASKTVVVEELLEGRECSYFCLISDSKSIVPLGFAVDFKRLKDKDIGPNTGGMGCYTPVDWLEKNSEQEVLEQVVNPTLEALKEQGISYTGFLYVGLMWTAKGPKVIEFNVRLGDPEAQLLAVCSQLDWAQVIFDLLNGKPVSKERADSADLAAVGVVMCSNNYPYADSETIIENISLEDIAESNTIKVFSSSLKIESNKVQTGKGRVCTVVGLGKDIESARSLAYKRVDQISSKWKSCQFRSDIALTQIKGL